MSKHKKPHDRNRAYNRQHLTVAYIASKQNQDDDMVDHHAWYPVGLSYWRDAGYAQGSVVDCTSDRHYLKLEQKRRQGVRICWCRRNVKCKNCQQSTIGAPMV